MDAQKDMNRREFLGRTLGLGLWALLLYPFTKYWSKADKKMPRNVSRHPAGWYKKLAG